MTQDDAVDAAGVDAVGMGTALAVTSVASVQFGAAIAAHLFARVGPLGTVSLRLVGAAIVLVIATRPWRREWTRRSLRLSLFFGVVFTVMNASLYLAIDRLPLATVITLEFLGPLGVSLATAIGWRTRVWALPAAAGVALLGGTVAGGDLVGVGFALLAACCWAGYILLSGRVGRTGSGVPGLAVGAVLGAVLMAPVGIATAGADLLRPSTVAIGLGVGVLSSAIPYSLDLLALRRLPTAVFGVLTSLNPGMAALAGFLLLDQTLSLHQSLGVGLVMAASVGITITTRRSRPDGSLRMIRALGRVLRGCENLGCVRRSPAGPERSPRHTRTPLTQLPGTSSPGRPVSGSSAPSRWSCSPHRARRPRCTPSTRSNSASPH